MSYFKDVFKLQCRFTKDFVNIVPRGVYEDCIVGYLDMWSSFKNVFKLIPLIGLLGGIVFGLGVLLVSPLVLILYLLVVLPIFNINLGNTPKSLSKFYKNYIYNKED